MAGDRLWVIGPGRVGLAVATLLDREGLFDALVVSGRSENPPDHPLFRAPAPPSYIAGIELPSPPPTCILIAVPDAAIPELAAQIAELELPPGVPVLHTSGSLTSDALAPLASRGVPVGSIHPLAAVTHGLGGVDRLSGAWFAIEGDEPAVRFAERIAAAAKGRAMSVPAELKPRYHAAAVFASNYIVTLLDVAERLAESAGVPLEVGRAALAELAGGAIANVAAAGPEHALTGPIRRGDDATVARHLDRLSAAERELYSSLARETLALARRAGLDAAAADRIATLLDRGSG